MSVVQRSIVLVLSLLAAGAAGCHRDQPAVSRDGAVEFTVRPAFGAPRLRGTVMLRGLDNALHTRVSLDADALQDVRVPLPAGTYGLDFEAPLSNDALASGAVIDERLTTSLPRMVVVFPQHVTTVNVHSVPNPAPSGEVLVTSEAASAGAAVSGSTAPAPTGA